MKLENKFLKDYRRMFRLISQGGTFVALDTETTGLNSENCRIIEVGAVKFDKNGIIKKFWTLVDPGEEIPDRVTEITGITDSMVIGKPSIEEILGELILFLEDSIIVGHNVQFDLRFLKAECERKNFSPIKNRVIDTLQFSRGAFPELKSYKQTELAKLLGISQERAHRALDDAEVCGNLFLRLIAETSQRQKP